ncbi:MAG: ABC-2 transporter permease [Micrococcaceae bacterium]
MKPLEIAKKNLKQDKVLLVIAPILIGLLPIFTYRSFLDLFPTDSDKYKMAAEMGTNGFFKILIGPIYDITTPGGFTAWRVGAFTALFAAICIMIGIIRTSRKAEENSSVELLLSTPIKRNVPLAASFTTLAISCILLGVTTFLTLLLNGAPFAGTTLLSLAFIFITGTFGVIALLLAQIFDDSPSATAYSLGLVAFTFLIRVLGDSKDELHWISWMSPFEWVNRTESYAKNVWDILTVPAAVIAVLSIVVWKLYENRDIGDAYIHRDYGKPNAPKWLKSTLALSYKLNTASLLRWTISTIILALVMSQAATSAGDVASASSEAEQVFQRLGDSLTMNQAMVNSLIIILAIVLAVFPSMMIRRMTSEEHDSHLAFLLSSGPVSRIKWYFSYVLLAVLVTIFLFVVAALIFAWNTSRVLNGVAFEKVFLNIIGYLPASLLIASIAALLYTMAQSTMKLTMLPITLVALITIIGPIFNLPDWAIKVSPFASVPNFYETNPYFIPSLIFVGAAIVIFCLSALFFKRRDIESI